MSLSVIPSPFPSLGVVVDRQRLCRYFTASPQHILEMSTQPTLLGLSGPSSCGKTTLARLLTSIFPHSSILHADDYYFPDSKIPMRNGVQDWDCAEAIDIKRLVGALKRMKAGESVEAVRDGLPTTETPAAEAARSAVDDPLLERLRSVVGNWEADMKAQRPGWARPQLILIDGFLLFGDSVREIRDQLDIKILLRSKYEDSKKRREAREGYETLEGFWQDPPGYFDQIVWPNFVKNHGFLFVDGDVQGQVNGAVAKDLGIDVVPGMGQRALEETLQYV